MPGLEDLYREIILDHYRNPRNRGDLEVPPAVRGEGFNPLCGDEIVIYLGLDGDTVSDVRFSGQGCSISQASASMMTAAIKGRTLSEIRALTRSFKAMMSIHENEIGGDGSEVGDGDGFGDGLSEGTDDETGHGAHEDGADGDGVALGDLEALRGVVKFPVRIKCATLGWNTLAQALDEVDAPAV
jgi:nitrogen fixation protein NifU and related proteins